MTHRKNPGEEWLRDVEERQRNVVFPDTVQNEARFWRNLGNQPWTPVTKVGLAVLGLFVLGGLGVLIFAAFQAGVPLKAALVVLIALSFWGAVFLAIAWATRRALRSVNDSKRKR